MAIDTPEALKASVGKDRVQIHTVDDQAAIAELAARFGLEAAIHEGAVTFSVASGEEFVPKLFAGLSRAPISSVSVSRPSLDDVFMSYTGTTVRDAEAIGHRRDARRGLPRAGEEAVKMVDTGRQRGHRRCGRRPRWWPRSGSRCPSTACGTISAR